MDDTTRFMIQVVHDCGGWEAFNERIKRRDGFSFDAFKQTVPATYHGGIETIVDWEVA